MPGGEENGSRGRPPTTANADRLRSLGRAIDRNLAVRRGPQNRRRIWIRRSIVAVGVVIILIIAGVAADYFYLGSLVHRTNVNNLQSTGPTENVLLIGSTTRCGLKVQNVAYGLCSQGVTGVNSDIVMILHLDPATRTVSLLSIPRDLFVPNARADGVNKIDAALYEGPSQLVAAIEEDFAIPINHYVELNFDTFANVVNALGGVRMYFPIPVYDADSDLNIEHPGCYLLDGNHALRLVRARHLQHQPTPSNHDPHTWIYEAQSDLARINRTHEFLRVLAAKVAARGLSDPLTDQSIATSVLPDLTVDSGFSEGSMVGLAKDFAHTSIDNVPQFTYPVIEDLAGSLLYQGYSYGDVVFALQPTGLQSVDKILDVAPGDNAFTGQALPAPSSFTISVENGSGVTNQAATVARELNAKGYRVRATGDETPTGPISETIVWYGGARPPTHGDWTSPGLAAAQSVLSQLQGPAVIGYDPAEVKSGALVTVVTGTDLSVSTKAVATTTTSTKKAHHSTSVTTTTIYDPPGVRTNNAFSAPSPVNPAQEPWDPTPCNAAGTGPLVTTTTTKK